MVLAFLGDSRSTSSPAAGMVFWSFNLSRFVECKKEVLFKDSFLIVHEERGHAIKD